MSRVIRLDDDIWEFLKKQPITLGQDHNDLLRKLLKISEPASQARPTPKTGGGLLGADKDYANLPISKYEFEGKTLSVKTYKEVLTKMCEYLRGIHANEFDEIALTLHGKKRNYFSRTASGMNRARQIAGSGVQGQKLYVESNLSATAIMGLCQYLVRRLKHDVSTFKVH
jgi:negative regulator of replication initiation